MLGCIVSTKADFAYQLLTRDLATAAIPAQGGGVIVVNAGPTTEAEPWIKGVIKGVPLKGSH